MSSLLNPSSYAIPGHSVYEIINTHAMSTTGVTSVSNSSGSFTLTVTSLITLYYIVIGGGGGGGSGSQGGGGRSAGKINYGSLSIPIGTYSCSLQVGGGGNYAGSGSFSNGTNGYGCIGGTSTWKMSEAL